MRTLGPPKRVLRRLVTQRLGKEIGEAKKQGFSIPIHPWLRGPLRPALEGILSKGSVDATGFLDTAEVLRQRDRHLSGRAQLGFELWGLMVLVEWHRMRIREARSESHSTELRRVTFPEVGPAA
jgi:asparagine synthase (glutamine-hydrolysing)